MFGLDPWCVSPDNFELLRTVTVPSFYMWTKRNFLEDLDGLWEALAPPKSAAMYEGEHSTCKPNRPSIGNDGRENTLGSYTL